MRSRTVPPQAYFAGSAVFHYLGPAFAVLLFARVAPAGVAWLRIVSAAIVFAVWRRPWRALRGADRATKAPPSGAADHSISLVVALGVVLAVMNVCFYEAIARLPLGTVSAIEFLPVILLAAVGMRSARNGAALALAVVGVYVLTRVQLRGVALGFALAFANAGLFAVYIVLAHRISRAPTKAPPSGAADHSTKAPPSGAADHSNLRGIDGLGAAMLVAAVAITPLGGAAVVPHLLDPIAVAAGIGVGISSSVIPYVCDQLAMARLRRETYSLMVSLLPATATVVGLIVLGQVPTVRELIGVCLVVSAVAVHREGAIEGAAPQPRPGGRAGRAGPRIPGRRPSR
jgi:inner membrane transporter RhtA